MITNNSFVDGITHRQMRQSLLSSFNRLHVLNLHGSSKKKEKAPDGSEDENVFDIQQGVSTTISVLWPATVERKVLVNHLWGKRIAKYAALAESSVLTGKWADLRLAAPYFFFTEKNFDDGAEYNNCMSLKSIFVVSGNGVKTERDGVSIHFTKQEIEASVRDFQSLDEGTLRRKYETGDDSRDWKVNNAKADVLEHKGRPLYWQLLYRPFDIRHTWYSGQTRGFIGTPAFPTMRHMRDGNVAMVTTRQTAEEFDLLCTDKLVGHKSVAGYDINTAFPLYTFEEALSFDLSEREVGASHSVQKHPNFSAPFLKSLCAALSLPQKGPHGLPADLTPEDIFNYAYSVFRSPGYRSRYAEFLKIDFPRLPLTDSLELFRALARLGSVLVALHLMESPKLDDFITTYTGPKNPEVGRVGWSSDTVWLDAAATKKGQPATPGSTGFRGVPEAVWNFHIGGYQVCEKWLKDRKGRTLTQDHLAHYQKIVVALNETIRLMKEIDAVIERHGGWPAAFQVSEAKTTAAELISFRPRIVQPEPKERYVTCVPLVPLKVAAGAFGDPQHIEDDGFEWVAVETRHRLRPGMFVAQVVGKSMEPAIPDGSYCLFAAPVEGSRQGRTVLVQLRDATDPETGQRYTVKRYESEKTKDGDSWRHTTIMLKPVNSDFEPIVLSGADDDQLQVVAELVDLLPER